VTRKLPLLGLLPALASAACALPHYYAPHPCDRPDLTGCVIADVSVSGARQVPASTIKEKIATAESSHALGGVLQGIPILSLWDRITVDYEQLDPFVLDRDLARVERLYRARGYYEAHARAARVRKTGPERVRVEIVVDEGEPVVIGNVQVVWKGQTRPNKGVQTTMSRRAARGLSKGAPFAEQAFEDLKKRLQRTMTDGGYAYAAVEGQATVDLATRRVDIVYSADAGPHCTFGPIRIEGAGDLPEGRLRQAIAIEEKQPFSTGRIESAQAALSDLRVLGSVDATPELSTDPEHRNTVIPVVFRLTPTTLKTLKMGFGGEFGNRVGAHGLAGWENKNFLGGLRSFSVEGKPGLVFFPYTLTTLFNGAATNFALVPELRVHSTLTQPGFIEGRTRGLVTANLDMYQLQPTDTLGYLEFSTKLGVERDLWGSRIHLGLYANGQIDQPLKLQIPGAQVLDTARGYHFLAVPYLQSTFALDLRSGANGRPDPINPHSGVYVTSDLQFAVAGSQDVRFRPEIRGYIPISKKVTLAIRVGGGILHAFGGDLATTPTPTTPYPAVDTHPKTPSDPCNPQPTGHWEKLPGGGQRWVEDTRNRWIQVMQLRGFNSGGTNSNRGYAYSAVSPQEIVPGISPMTSVVGGTAENPIKTCSPLPTATGGMAMWEASVELRFPVYEKLGLTVFVDGSDVRQKVADFGAPFAPHLTTGIGVHYATPVGPLRIDVGVRIPGAQVVGSTCPIFDPTLAPAATTTNTCDPNRTSGDRNPAGGYLDPKYGQAGSFRGIPLALSLAIGEAF
jgi:outer membrane protein insertion porin family/translocation and assembly module TamA